jgi:CHAD domain-containing protein
MAPVSGAVDLVAGAIGSARARLEEALARFVVEPSGEPLHDLRVALRRSAAVGALFEDLPSEGAGVAVRQGSRDLRRRLSEARQLGVSAELLGDLLRKRELRGRRRLASALSRGWENGDGSPGVDDVRAAADSVLEALGAWALAAAEWRPEAAEEKRVGKLVTKRIRQRRKRLLAVGVPDEKTLHEQRVAGKALRYQLEVIVAVEPAAGELVRAARRFQEVLGAAHDLACLYADLDRSLRARPRRPLGGLEILLAVEDRRARAFREAREEARRFLRELKRTRPRVRFPLDLVGEPVRTKASAGKPPRPKRRRPARS